MEKSDVDTCGDCKSSGMGCVLYIMECKHRSYTKGLTVAEDETYIPIRLPYTFGEA